MNQIGKTPPDWMSEHNKQWNQEIHGDVHYHRKPENAIKTIRHPTQVIGEQNE